MHWEKVERENNLISRVVLNQIDFQCNLGATDTEQKSFVGVLFEFLEHQNDFLAFDRENWSLAGDGKTKYVGDLARIQKSFSAAAAPPRQKNTATSFLVTRSTGELLSKIRADSGGGDAAGGKEVEEDDKKQILPLLNASNNSGAFSQIV